jgi:hypothetical protein
VSKDKNLSLPEDITTLSGEELDAFVAEASARVRELHSSGTTEFAQQTAEADEMASLAGNVRQVRLEKARRADQFSKNDATKADAQALLDELAAEEAAAVEAVQAETPAVETVTASTRPQGGATTQPVQRGVFKNPSLADAQTSVRQQPAERRESVLTASADIPGFGAGVTLNGMADLTTALTARAKSLPITSRGDDAPRYPIAALNRTFKYSLDMQATPEQINEVLTAAMNPEILIAAGGWCSPSEISYDFFNLVCDDGALDLPTVGINRGGIRWPISPSFADVTASTALWSWTETQDIAAVTGTAQSGTKTCGRVPCVTFDEERLHCDGICLTVGNLTEDSYPELISNFTKLLFAAHFHKMNRARINELRTLSASFTVTNGSAGSGVVAPVLGALELQAIDYRARYAMCKDALLEVIAPKWLRGAMRSDLRKRMGSGTDMLSVSDAYLMELFDALNIRVQWVSDYQERTTGFPGMPTTLMTAWPTTVEFMMMAPGTAVLGQGLRLDLGIIRDSVLNATNDHTAEWMEECWLIFNPGHEIRRLTVNICPDGTTGAADLVACDV